MANRFTQRAQKVIKLAQDEARRLETDFVDPGHILLAILRLREGVAWEALSRLKIDFESIHGVIEAFLAPFRIGRSLSGEIPFNPAAKRVLEKSVEAAIHLGDHHVGTEHMLLALLVVEEGCARPVLKKAGLDSDKTRAAVLEVVHEEPSLAIASPAQPGSLPDAASGKPLSRGELFERIVFAMPRWPGFAGCLVTLEARKWNTAEVQILVLLKPGADYEDAWAALKKDIPGLYSSSIQFKLPLQKPVFREGGVWKLVEGVQNTLTL